ncbi:hypothetical protein BC939DRAFT_257119 [Gamsiella multidivaricata]|uniref:uncharacterized protein n=1 Tax=Gamsiella multidivaricata TaxID=101098 RepID=UPI00221E3F26|nr:uncharacterized protein BC939DRAFT_257119 [Gamsiella multidivaricata]KAI7830625.1 hypothetical protein BC939DRAFT_257119 [Gamsiella multidivaricata]
MLAFGLLQWVCLSCWYRVPVSSLRPLNIARREVVLLPARESSPMCGGQRNEQKKACVYGCVLALLDRLRNNDEGEI